MRIAMIGQKGLPAKFGGVETHVQGLSLRMASLGHEVVVYCRSWYSSTENQISEVKIKKIPSLHTKHLDTVTHTLLATIHAMVNNFDVIHFHGVGPALFSWLPKLFSKKTRVFITFHSMDRKHGKWGFVAKQFLKLGEWCSARFADRTIAVSETIKQYLLYAYNCEALYLPNCIELPKKSLHHNYLLEWNIEPKKYILVVSRLIPCKGIHYLIAAFNILKKQQLTKDLKLVIVGGGYYSSEYENSLKKMAKENEDIIITGFQSGEALRQFYSHPLFMVHPSSVEGMPTAVLEGMGYGLQILLSDIPEHKCLISNSHYLFEHDNIISLKNNLLNLINMEEEERWKAGYINKEKISKNYCWDNLIYKYDKLYKGITSRTYSTSR